jgi:predicted nucleotidyltransferase
MDRAAVDEISQRFGDALEHQGISIDSIVLFGSYAAGTAREDSDIDLVVISPDVEGMNLWERAQLVGSALTIVREDIEAVIKTPAEWEAADSLLITFAKENGEVVYSRG